MTILALALFGSCARGDATPGSDVDLMVFTTEQRVRHAAMGNISLYLYPWAKLLRDARGGDLFVCHIVHEAKPLHDPKDLVPKLRKAFRFKDSYAPEIRNAADLGWYIIRKVDDLPGQLATKRIAWCVRTILIAKTAERRAPLFSATALAKSSKIPHIYRLITLKAKSSPTRKDIALFLNFLVKQGYFDPVPSGDNLSYITHFKAHKNRVALQTLSAGVDYV